MARKRLSEMLNADTADHGRMKYGTRMERITD
jgi:hypothetical protein